MPVCEGLSHNRRKGYHCAFCDLKCSNTIDYSHFCDTRRWPTNAPSSLLMTCWSLRHSCHVCPRYFCSISEFKAHLWLAHCSGIVPRWILRNVEAPNTKNTGWKCRFCPLDTFVYDKLLHHVESKADYPSHLPAFCCLYCAEAHHTRQDLEKHLEKHSTITSPQESLNVSVGVKDVELFSFHHNVYDAARLVRHLIAQDTETGATMPVFSGHQLGEIYCPFNLLHPVKFSCGLSYQCTTFHTLKVAFWLQVESGHVPDAITSRVTITMTIQIIWTSSSSSSTLLDDRSSGSRHEKHGHLIKS